jgi:hypothetical protein
LMIEVVVLRLALENGKFDAILITVSHVLRKLQILCHVDSAIPRNAESSSSIRGFGMIVLFIAYLLESLSNKQTSL